MGLVDENACLTWLVAPRIDQPTIISGLVDPERGGGVEFVFPDSTPVAHRHREGTLVVETDLEIARRDAHMKQHGFKVYHHHE